MGLAPVRQPLGTPSVHASLNGRRFILLFLPATEYTALGEGRTGLPVDLLIATDDRVLACNYGAHAYDQWSIDELLVLANKPVTM